METRQFFIENGIQEEPLSSEQELYLDAANKKVEGECASPPIAALLLAARGEDTRSLAKRRNSRKKKISRA